MDKQNNIVDLASKFACYANEAFLITLANKGFYNRAVKDMASVTSWEISADGDSLLVSFDDITVTLNQNLAKSACSCPSKTVCKHILMAVLHTPECLGEGILECSEDNSIPVEQPHKDLYACFKNIDIEAFKKKAGKKVYESSGEALLNGVKAEFSEGEMLSCHITDDGISVFFTPGGSVEAAVCKCGVTGLCRHKVMAVLSYLMEHSGLVIDDESISAEIISKDDVALLDFAKSVIVNIFKKGGSMCGESDMDACAQLATRLASENLDNIAKLFRSLASSIENMIGKKASFNQINMTSILCRIFNTLTAVLNNIDNREMLERLVEGGRNKYFGHGTGSFTGLGAYPWQTASGFSGVTAYLLHDEEKIIYTYTTTQANYYENTASFGGLASLTGCYTSQSNWENGVSIKNMSQYCMVLKNYKTNSDKRLSSSKATVSDVQGKTNRFVLEKLELIKSCYNEALQDIFETQWDYFGGAGLPIMCFLDFSTLSNVSFDKATQTLTFDISNSIGESVSLEIVHSEVNSIAFEYFKNYKGGDGVLFCRALKVPEGIKITPVSLIDGNGVNNIYFEVGENDKR